MKEYLKITARNYKRRTKEEKQKNLYKGNRCFLSYASILRVFFKKKKYPSIKEKERKKIFQGITLLLKSTFLKKRYKQNKRIKRFSKKSKKYIIVIFCMQKYVHYFNNLLLYLFLLIKKKIQHFKKVGKHLRILFSKFYVYKQEGAKS